jgi:hypothetical protein
MIPQVGQKMYVKLLETLHYYYCKYILAIFFQMPFVLKQQDSMDNPYNSLHEIRLGPGGLAMLFYQ